MKSTFRRDAVGWVVVLLNTLAVLNSPYFFLAQLRVGVVGWLMLNTCAPSVVLFLLGFLLSNPMTMVAASVLMFRYGMLGLFVFNWDGYNIIPQVGHILMTLAVIYTLVDIIRHRRWKALILGAVLGLTILIPLMALQGAWFNAHPGMLESLFSGNLIPESP